MENFALIIYQDIVRIVHCILAIGSNCARIADSTGKDWARTSSYWAARNKPASRYVPNDISEHQRSPGRGRERVVKWHLDQLVRRGGSDGGRGCDPRFIQGHHVVFEKA